MSADLEIRLIATATCVSMLLSLIIAVHCHGRAGRESESRKQGRAIAERPTSEPAPAEARDPGCPSPEGVSPGLLGPSHPILDGFRGDSDWIHRREGHIGRPYWPDGASGVTLDPGIDLGHAEPWLIELAYRRRTNRSQWNAIEKAMGLRGERADRRLRNSRNLRSIRIDRTTAGAIFPYLLRPYWQNLQQRFPSIEDRSIPPEVQTALLSLAYNRGAWNPELGRLRLHLERGDWHAVAALIRSMQQDHLLPGIRRRRRIEGLLISKNLPPRSARLCPSPPAHEPSQGGPMASGPTGDTDSTATTP